MLLGSGSADISGLILQKSSTRPSGDRSLVALTAILLALAAVIALASRSSDQAMDSSPRTLLEEEPAHKVHVNLKRPVPTGKLSKQQLAEAFSSYNKKTGYLINRLSAISCTALINLSSN